MDTDIYVKNKIIFNIKFLACSFIDINCEFINCEFKNGCLFNESWKFTKCNFDKHCNFAINGAFAKGCKFVQCTFDNILAPNFKI